MSKYYFTYGSEGYPFVGGWTEIVAPDRQRACKLFMALHPHPEYPEMLNCCWCYDEHEFQQTCMAGTKGNIGAFCHERLSYELCDSAHSK